MATDYKPSQGTGMCSRTPPHSMVITGPGPRGCPNPEVGPTFIMASRTPEPCFPKPHLTGAVMRPHAHWTGGLVFEVAEDLRSVLQAWELTYTAYRRDGRIEFNHQHLYTVPQAVGSHSAVVLGRINDLAVSTLTCILDGPAGLPLSTSCQAEIESLRRRETKLMEVTLLGDRREHLTRSMAAMFNLIRFAFYFGRHNGVDQIVMAAAAEHAPFFARCFGFEAIAGPVLHPGTRSTLIVPLRLNLASLLAGENKPRSLTFCLENPLGPEVFQNRFRFEPASVERSPIGEFLRSGGGLAFPASDPRAPIPAA